MSSSSTKLFEFESPPLDPSKDGLFIERLDALLQKSLGDIKAFAERELRPYEETRRRIAEWHARYLFQSQPPDRSGKNPLQVTSILRDTSRVLESLSDLSGVQSFILAINPKDPSDNGFLGGSVVGREFWRGLRGGGEAGARAFKTQCGAHLQNKKIVSGSHPRTQLVERHVSAPPAKSVKSELYESVRNALRSASGVRSAEMKWTNPERLDVYGVRLVGWPEGIPYQNPSTLKVNQNKTLLEAIQRKSMKFVKIAPEPTEPLNTVQEDQTIDEDFSWAYDADAVPASPAPTSLSDSSALPRRSTVAPLTSIDTPNSWIMDSTRSVMTVEGNDTGLMTHDEDYSWQTDFGEEVLDLGVDWREEPNPTFERPKKRHRSGELETELSDH